MAYDNFTNTDGTVLTDHTTYNKWTVAYGGTPGAYIYSNMVRQNAYATTEAYASESTNDVSQVTVKEASSDSTVAGPAVRIQATDTGYYCYLTQRVDGYYTRIVINKNRVWKSTKFISADQFDDHTLKMTATGTDPVTLEVFLDGETVGTYVDSTDPIASGYSGIFVSNNTSSATLLLDDWTDTNDGASSTSPSVSPSLSPSVSPSGSPSLSPSASVSVSPSESPSASPSTGASSSLSPSSSSSASPSVSPSNSPSASPSASTEVFLIIDSGFTGGFNG